jgi:predicted DsbA family dithiol-disulfide isomerase
MTSDAETVAGSIDSGGTVAPSARRPQRASVATLQLDIVSDTICPWCYVGKRRIDRAVEVLAAEGLTIITRWLPYELNPRMPDTGMNRREYRSAKFGSWAHSQALDDQVAAEGAREGITFRHDRMERTPNTRASHRLIWLAGELGGAQLQNRTVEALFAAYFTNGRDVGDKESLADIGVAAGMTADGIGALFASGEGLDEVQRQEDWAMSAGIRGVPSVIASSMLLFSGAQRTQHIVDALREIAGLDATAARTVAHAED